MRTRREFAVAVGLCAAGAALVLLAAGRTWVAEAATRPELLSSQGDGRSGGDLLPWLPALGWVALAGAGAVVATRAAVRRAVGCLLGLAGVVVAAGAAWGVIGGRASLLWPVLCALGGLLVAGAGGLTAVRGAGWPVMGARYERPATSRAGTRPERPDQLWDALDRGEDPTA